MTEPTSTSSQPQTPAAPTPPPAAPKPQAPQQADQGTKAFASNAEPTVTDQEKADIAARDEAVEAKAAAYEEVGETAAAEAVRAQFEDKPADAPA